MTGDRPVLTGVLVYALVVVTPTLLVWAAIRLVPLAFAAFAGIASRAAAALRRVRGPAAEVVVDQPDAPTFEQTVRDLRRLRAELRTPPANRVRRVALLAAYDDALITVSRQVGGPASPLVGVTDAERPFARLQTEAAVEAAGVVLDPPRAGPTAV